MRCSTAKRLLPAYLGGALVQKKRDALEAHLYGCASCSREAERIRKMWTWIEEVEAFEPSDLLWPRVVRRIREEEARQALRPRWGLRVMSIARVASIAAVLALGIFIGRYLATPATPQGTGRAAVQQVSTDSDTELKQFRLDLFDDLPPTSVGGAYVILVSE